MTRVNVLAKPVSFPINVTPVDSQYCLTCGGDKTVKLWNPFRSLFLKAYIGHGHEVLDAHSSGDNSHLCSGGLDKSVVLFDVESGKILRKFREHAGLSWWIVKVLSIGCIVMVDSYSVIHWLHCHGG